MKFFEFAAMVAALLFLSACENMDEPFALSEERQLAERINQLGGRQSFLLPDESDLATIPQDPRNPLTPEKVELGRLLFHETGIATEAITAGGLKTYSCASCHFAGAGFQAGTFQGIGDGGEGFGFNGERRMVATLSNPDSLDVQPIRTPTAMNGAYQEVMLWNGQFGATGVNEGTEASWRAGTPIANNFLGFQGLETQAIAGLGVHRLNMTSELAAELGYETLFDLTFPDIPREVRYNKVHAGLAIAAFERTLLSNRAPFQLWLRGNSNALTMEEIRGALLFFGKADCVSCHSGPALNSMTFHAQGMSDLVDCPEPTFGTSVDNGENKGRGGFTGNAEDDYKFKVPQLYSLRRSPFYGHGASFRNLRAVVAYKNNAEVENPRVTARAMPASFVPLALTEAEIDDLTTFLSSGLDDSSLRRYEPGALLSGQCFPNNDASARRDIGCD
ncbi:cytochrome-c peroxidase [Neolewinella persica]|uniref:cytochrome-c peroxidase n=1 Tax=Neolewinella persica TaxID=70998 RepID=UPI0003754E76|nr:cytochrome c peroxidase [Neolewinella persica]